MLYSEVGRKPLLIDNYTKIILLGQIENGKKSKFSGLIYHVLHTTSKDNKLENQQYKISCIYDTSS